MKYRLRLWGYNTFTPGVIVKLGEPMIDCQIDGYEIKEWQLVFWKGNPESPDELQVFPLGQVNRMLLTKPTPVKAEEK